MLKNNKHRQYTLYSTQKQHIKSTHTTGAEEWEWGNEIKGIN